MAFDNSAIEVIHNRERQRFEVQLDGQVAELNYRMVDGAYAITHTGVPVEYRGRGIADKLAAAALAHIQAEGRKVIPMCSFIQTYIRRHKQYAGLVAA